jgi:uncharacterized OsmC-like protein
MSAPGVAMKVELHGLTCRLTHEPSGAVIQTTPPRDNGGDGTSFSPTDLVGAALASCAISTMALQAAREGLSWGDASARVVKEMVGPPRRIGTLSVEITMPAGVKPEHRARLEEIAHGCPVARSLHGELKLPITFRYA